MNFSAFFLKSFRVLLLPFALVYGIIIIIRNWMYDKGYFKSSSFNFPLICVGNLSVGGTGKSPMVEYLLRLLQHDFNTATLSRGYKRKTKGYALAGAETTALEIGDEPMQFHIKFPDVAVAVGEERIDAVAQLLHDKPNLNVIVLDDAFQHRSVKAGFNIVLTDFNNLYTRDLFLPTGDLRDSRFSAARADVIVVTKCPADLTDEGKRKIIKELKPLSKQHIFFTTIAYGTPYHITNKQERNISHQDEVLLVCGIANPTPLKQFIIQQAKTYYLQSYNDHHIFTIDDLNEIKTMLNDIDAEHKIIITTEKDAVRLIKFQQTLADTPLYVLPIKHQFLFNEGAAFDALVISFIRNFKTVTTHEQEEVKK
jgi:tetraacyldisaccharide 4'-kinase